MRSISAPPKYNHDNNMTIPDVDIIELVPIEQAMKLPVENEIKHVDMEPAQVTLKEEEEEEDSKRNVSNTNTLSSIM